MEKIKRFENFKGKDYSILDIIHRDKDEEEDEGITTDEEFIEKYDLNGDIFLSKGEWDDDSFMFYCGPSCGGDDYLSDSVFIKDEYYKKLMKTIGVKINTDLAENYHEFNTDDKEKAEDAFKKLKTALESDGFTVIVD